MRIATKTKYILEKHDDLNDPTFKGVTFSDYYQRTDNPGVVVVGFKKADHGDWLEVETPWSWLNEELKMKLRPI
jgi:hypothetical protein